jgi:ankyrin repeat protein
MNPIPVQPTLALAGQDLAPSPLYIGDLGYAMYPQPAGDENFAAVSMVIAHYSLRQLLTYNQQQSLSRANYGTNCDTSPNLLGDFPLGSLANLHSELIFTTGPVNNTMPVNNDNTEQPPDQQLGVGDSSGRGTTSAASVVASKRGWQPIHHAVEAGSASVVKLFLEKSPECAHSRTPTGVTPLFLACLRSHTKVVKMLVETYKAEVNISHPKTQRTPLHNAVTQNVDMTNLLLEHGAHADARDHLGVSPLIMASQGGFARTVSLLVGRHDIELDATTTNGGRTALHQAAECGHTEVVQILLEKGANADTRDTDGYSPLYSAARNGFEQIAKMLLVHKADPDIINTTGTNRRPLHLVAHNGHTAVCKLLLDYKATLEPLDHTNCSPLFFAAQEGHSEIVEIMLAEGANPDNAWEGLRGRGRRCLHQAAQNGHLEVVRLLLEAGANPNPEDYTPVGDAENSSIGNGSDESSGEKASRERNTNRRGKTTPKKSEKRKQRRNVSDNTLTSPLGMAAFKGYYDIAKLLIEKGADVNFTTDATQPRPVHFAAASGNGDLVKLLIEHKANVDEKDPEGWLPITIAAARGFCNVIDILIERGADINGAVETGLSALSIACSKGHTAIVKRLLDAGARSFPENTGTYPVHRAAANAHFEVLKLLVEREPDCIHLKDEFGSSVISCASYGREPVRLGIVEYLISKGAPVMEHE